MTSQTSIISITDRPDLIEAAALWFHNKWGVPLQAYRESMREALQDKEPVPQWYLALERTTILGGVGVIENDFHERKDLRPNVCALYVEEDVRSQGLARRLLDHVCQDMKRRGIATLYLVTELSSFYERCGWEYLCCVEEDMTQHELPEMEPTAAVQGKLRMYCKRS